MVLNPCKNLTPHTTWGNTPKTFPRIVNYADGWMPIAGFVPLEQQEQAINALGETARKANKNPSDIHIVVLTYPNLLESSSNSSSNLQRMPMTGTIDQIGSDIEWIKAMGAEHIIFGYAFSPIGKDTKKYNRTYKTACQICQIKKDRTYSSRGK